MVSGIQVIDGSGRSSETNGSTIAFAGHHTAITTPSGTATRPASAKPAKTRSEEISTELQQLAAGDQFLRLGDDLPGRGQEDRRDRAGRGGEMPGEQERGDGGEFDQQAGGH